MKESQTVTAAQDFLSDYLLYWLFLYVFFLNLSRKIPGVYFQKVSNFSFPNPT
jgi:hypothetical protein